MTDTAYVPVSSSSSSELTVPAAPEPIARTRALSIASLVTSGVGLLLGLGVVGVAGIVLGFIARRDEPSHRTLSTWGIVLGFVAVFGWLLLALVGAAAVLPFWLAGAFGN